MTAGYQDATERVLALLPVHVRNRDDASGGLLRALIEAVAAELAVLEADLDELYASWFAETCPEWVVPYLAPTCSAWPTCRPMSPARGPQPAGVRRQHRRLPAAQGHPGRGGAGGQGRDRLARPGGGVLPAAGRRDAHPHVRFDQPATHTQPVRLARPATVSLRTLPADGGPLELVPRTAARARSTRRRTPQRSAGSPRARAGTGSATWGCSSFLTW